MCQLPSIFEKAFEIKNIFASLRPIRNIKKKARRDALTGLLSLERTLTEVLESRFVQICSLSEKSLATR